MKLDGNFLPSLNPQRGSNNKLMPIVLITTLIWMLVQSYVQPIPEEKKTAAPSEASTVANATPPPAGLPPPPTADSVPVLLATPEDLTEETHTIEPVQGLEKNTGHTLGGLRLSFSNRGASIVDATLTGYKEIQKATSSSSGTSTAASHVNFVDNQNIPLMTIANASQELDGMYQVVEKTADHILFKKTYGNGLQIEQRYSVKKETPFILDHYMRITNIGDSTLTVEPKVSLHKKNIETKESGFFAMPDILHARCHGDEETLDHSLEDIQSQEGNRYTLSGKALYAALTRHYFVAALASEKSSSALQTCFMSLSHKAPAVSDVAEAQFLATNFQYAPSQLATQSSWEATHQIYVGPKQSDALKLFGHNLESSVDFGWLAILCWPLLKALIFLKGIVGNYGWAIVLLTVIIKLLTLPLAVKTYRSMAEMKKVAPQLKALQEKYGHDRAIMGQKQMELYQKQGINPLSGCLPMLIQMPIWFALYRTLSMSAELYQQPWLAWITDLTAPDVSPLWGWPLLPIVVGMLSFWQTTQTPPPEDQPQMKYVMYGMPIFFTFLMLNIASGLSIYMITNSFISIVQQIVLKRLYGEAANNGMNMSM